MKLRAARLLRHVNTVVNDVVVSIVVKRVLGTFNRACSRVIDRLDPPDLSWLDDE